MASNMSIDPNLTYPDLLVLKNLLKDVDAQQSLLKASHDSSLSSKSSSPSRDSSVRDSGYESQESSEAEGHVVTRRKGARDGEVKVEDDLYNDSTVIDAMTGLNNPKDDRFEPTVFVTWDLKDIKIPPLLRKALLDPYIAWAQTIVRVPTDVVMLTHLILYFTTSVPSALFLFYHFTWIHAVLHVVMQGWYVGTYTLLRHQHIHMNGVLAPKYAWFDQLFPYVTDPLMGHTWNSYFYHHVKHHHVEGNGPNDLSTTIRYQRDELVDFLHYVGRFFVFIWFELPLYFIRKNKPIMALKAGGWEIGNYVAIYLLAAHVNTRAAIMTLVVPLALLRVGLMVGNWGQHAFVDEVEPDSDFRSSITLIDVASNRFCYNDGYHTSHHLNPRRHWREHPVSFLKQKQRYADEHALVFANIDYVMLTVRLLMKDYDTLAKCLVPMGKEQVGMSMEERKEMLRRKTRKFDKADIEEKFGKAGL